MQIRTVSVLGAGTMGHGIAQVSAMAGLDARLFDIDAAVTERAMEQVRRNLDKGVARGKVAPDVASGTLARLSAGSDLAEACFGADIVIEAVPERMELKREVLGRVQSLAPAHAVLASNTSSLSIAGIAEVLTDPGRLIGLHFFNPVHIMKLLELVVHDGTRPEVLQACLEYGERLGKSCITVRDFPGFATSRLGVCLGMEAIRMVEQGVASAEDIDTAMVLGYRHPVGPLKLSDLVGLDVRMQIGEYLARELGNPAFEPPELMRKMVAEGRLGRKTGRGFYDWD